MERLSERMLALRNKLLDRFSEIQEPRLAARCEHNLLDILVIAFCSTACGFFSYRDMQWFGMTRLGWFQSFLELPSGVPSHDTFRRVLGMVAPVEVERVLRHWARLMAPEVSRVLIDGKALKGTEKGFNTAHRPLILVNVYDHERGLVMSQEQATSTGISEFRAASESLRLLNIKGALVSVDAGISGIGFTTQVSEQGGDYIVPIKKNHAKLYEILSTAQYEEFGTRAQNASFCSRTEEQGHGRHEIRTCRLLKDKAAYLKITEIRAEVKTIFKVTRIRETLDRRFNLQQRDESTGAIGYVVNPNQGKKRVSKSETVYYISSRELNPEQCLKHVREHWGIENNLHWILDVAFEEDACRVRDKRAARTLSALRKMAHNIFQSMPDPTEGIKGPEISRKTKMKLAALKPGYLEEFLMKFADPKRT